ncbi:MAG: nucleotide exchange factor GrpE [Chitinivibrionales bacterium]|nr:nucleotide exchange factor GrpE [Chitinivibrionales bacterium]
MKKNKLTEEEKIDKKQDQGENETVNEEVSEETAEPSVEEGTPEEGGEEVLVENVESLKEKLQAQKDSYVRLIAEFDNFKRRTAKEYERIVANANERLMLEITEVRENFERALRAEESGGDLQKFLEGMKMIFSKLDEILAKNGLKPFTEVGDPFDPNLHDALMKRHDVTIPEDHIAEIYEKGYELKGKVIKHARVIVSEGKPDTEDEGGAESANEQKSE